MRHFILFISLLLLTAFAFSQAVQKRGWVSFTIDFKISSATKDGYMLNGYVVDIPYGKAQELNNKKIQVSGSVRIVKGVNNQIDSSLEVKQGRNGDTKYIIHPLLKIIQ